MTEKTITAIDLGSTKITTIIALLYENHKIEIKGIGTADSQGIESGVVRDIQKTTEAIRNSIDIAEKQAHRTAENVHVAVSGTHISSRNATGKISIAAANQPTEVDDTHILSVINDAKNSVRSRANTPGLEVVHCIPQLYDVDTQKGISNPIGLTGYSLNVHALLILAEENHLRNIRKAFEKANVPAITIILGAVATASAVVTDDELRLGCIMMDIGGGTADMLIYKNYCIHKYLCYPKGGIILSKDLEFGLLTTTKCAESLKIEYGDAMPPTTNAQATTDVEGIGGRQSQTKPVTLIAQIVQDRIKEILDACYNQILTEYPTMESLTAGVVLTGGTALLKNIHNLVEDETVFNLPCRVAYPATPKITGPVSKVDNPAFACAIGTLFYIAKNNPTAEPPSKKIVDISKNANEFLKTIINKIKDL